MTKENELTTRQREVVLYAKGVAKILIAGTVMAVAVIGAKLFGVEDIDVGQLSLPIKYAWTLFCVATVAHVFEAVFFIRAIHQLWKEQQTTDQGNHVFNEIKLESNYFLRGMIPRARPRHPGGRIYVMDFADPSTWIAHGAVLALVIATLPWRLEKGYFVWDGGLHLIPLALVLALANWLAGSNWAVALSQLTVPKNEAFYHLALERGSRRSGNT